MAILESRFYCRSYAPPPQENHIYATGSSPLGILDKLCYKGSLLAVTTEWSH